MSYTHYESKKNPVFNRDFPNDYKSELENFFQFNKIHLLFENKNKNKSHCGKFVGWGG